MGIFLASFRSLAHWHLASLVDIRYIRAGTSYQGPYAKVVTELCGNVGALSSSGAREVGAAAGHTSYAGLPSGDHPCEQKQEKTWFAGVACIRDGGDQPVYYVHGGLHVPVLLGQRVATKA